MMRQFLVFHGGDLEDDVILTPNLSSRLASVMGDSPSPCQGNWTSLKCVGEHLLNSLSTGRLIERARMQRGIYMIGTLHTSPVKQIIPAVPSMCQRDVEILG